MGYYNEMKDIRKELKKTMKQAGIKDFSMIGGKGSSYDWTKIQQKPSRREWTLKEQKILREDFGFHIGHPSNTLLERSHELKSKLYGYKAKGFKKKQKYKEFVEDFLQCARKQQDGGTCVLGAGTIIKKEGKPIDFIEQQGQGETRNWVAQKIMKDRAKLLGIEMKHEGGVMD